MSWEYHRISIKPLCGWGGWVGDIHLRDRLSRDVSVIIVRDVKEGIRERCVIDSNWFTYQKKK